MLIDVCVPSPGSFWVQNVIVRQTGCALPVILPVICISVIVGQIERCQRNAGHREASRTHTCATTADRCGFTTRHKVRVRLLAGFVALLTCCSRGRSRRLHDVSVDGLGPRLFLETSRSRLDDLVHVLHQFELLPPQILILDVFPPRPLIVLLLLFFLRFQPKEGNQETSR